MKYLNLINNMNSKSEFNAIIPNNFRIEKNSKIALQKLDLTFAGSQVVIDGTNSQIIFNPYPRTNLLPNNIGNQSVTITIPAGIYNNMNDLTKAIQNSLNQYMKLYNSQVPGFENYQGLQWQCFIDNATKKFSIQYCHADALVTYKDLLLNNMITDFNWGGGGPVGDWAGKTGGTDTTFDGNFVSRRPLSLSNNRIQFKLKTTDITAETIVGITKKGYSQGMILNLEDFTYAFFTKAGDPNWWIYHDGIEDQYEEPGNVIYAIDENVTVFSLWYGNNTVKFKIGTGGGDFQVQTDGFELADTLSYFAMATKQNDTYYIGYDTTIVANDISLVPNAFSTLDEDLHVIEQLPIRLHNNTLTANYSGNYRWFLFPDDLATLLNFPKNRIFQAPPADNKIESDNPIKPFISMTGFSPKNLVVQVPSLDLDSLSNKGMKNILAVVPNADRTDYELSYSVNEKLFININNREALNLSNIRVIVTDDLGFIFNVVPNTLNIALVIMDESDLRH